MLKKYVVQSIEMLVWSIEINQAKEIKQFIKLT
ncbi:hypothetical protein KCTC52924_01314 [Arenibacter antarcticus]